MAYQLRQRSIIAKPMVDMVDLAANLSEGIHNITAMFGEAEELDRVCLPGTFTVTRSFAQVPPSAVSLADYALILPTRIVMDARRLARICCAILMTAPLPKNTISPI